MLLAAVSACARRPRRELDRRPAARRATPSRRRCPRQSGAGPPTTPIHGTSEPHDRAASTEAPATSRRRPNRRNRRCRRSASQQLLADIPIGDVVNVDDNKPVRRLRRIRRRRCVRHRALVGRRLSRSLRRAVRATEWRRVGRIPRTPNAAPGLRRGSDQLPGSQPVRRLLLRSSTTSCMYDDGDQSLLAPLAAEFGPAVMGIVLAHEFGHAIQSRVGALDQFLPRSTPSSRPTASPAPGPGRRTAAESPLLRLGDCRCARRADRDARGPRPGRHRPVRRGRPRFGVRPRRRLPGGLRQRRPTVLRAARQSAAVDAEPVPVATGFRARGERVVRLLRRPRSQLHPCAQVPVRRSQQLLADRARLEVSRR